VLARPALDELVARFGDLPFLLLERADAIVDQALLLLQCVEDAIGDGRAAALVVAAADQLSDPFQLQPEQLQILDHVHAVHVGGAVVAEPPLAANGGLQEPELLVITERAQIGSRDARETADLQEVVRDVHGACFAAVDPAAVRERPPRRDRRSDRRLPSLSNIRTLRRSNDNGPLLRPSQAAAERPVRPSAVSA
jgi:hypothetical protein